MVQSAGSSGRGRSPVSYSAEGSPIGIQIVGRPWEEEQVLAVAAVLEKEHPAWKMPPIC